MGSARTVARRTLDALGDVERRDAQVRGRLAGSARHVLHAYGERLATRSARVREGAPAAVTGATLVLTARSSRLGPLASGHLAAEAERLAGWRRLLTAYDVDRQLERGYTLTLDAAGRPLRSARDVTVGSEMVTRFVDGKVRSRAETVTVRDDRGGVA